MSLNDSTDPLEWSEEFMKVVKEKGVEVDEDFMLGWFANAIMAGYDKARRKYEMVNAHDTLMRHVLGEAYDG
jgi:hypothetical protein